MIKSLEFTPKLQKRHLQKGETLFWEGDEGDFAYIIDEGEIDIITFIDGKYTVLNTLYPGNMFGELALVDGSPRSASACAKTDAILTIVTPEQVNSRIQEADPILRLLLTVVMKHFRSETGRSRLPIQAENQQPINEKPEEYICQISETIELIKLESDLRNAIEQEQLMTLYQPIVDLKEDRIIGFEMLLRWNCPTRGNISPAIFIPLAESTSLIVPIGEWLIEQAIGAIKEIKAKTDRDIFISINVAERQIHSSSFFPLLKQRIAQAGIRPEQIKIEILERSLFEGKEAMEWIQSCRNFGFPVVIDDFGTGYANLAYLKYFECDAVKIDKCFVDDLANSARDRSICNALIQLSQGLDMTVVAEGIETKEQALILKELGCNFGQGYWFSRPLPLKGAIASIGKGPSD